MNEKQLNTLAEIINKHTPEEGMSDTLIPGLQLFRGNAPNLQTPTIYNPSICLLVQGQKQVMLHKDIYKYNASEFLIISVDLPVIGEVTIASKDEPYLSLKIDIGVTMLSEVLINMEYPANQNDNNGLGLNIAKADQLIGNSVLHLIEMLNAPEDIPFLAVQTIREIFYRILRSEYGYMLAQIAFKGSHVERISRAIRKIKTGFHEKITVEELADIAGMSISGFHAHFKAVTSMSPLQFQKHMRLIEARKLMLTQDLSATAAAYEVGYESPSQFSREYSRMFGTPPARDVSTLKSQSTSIQNI